MPLTEKELLYATQIAYYDFDQNLINELATQNNGVPPTLQDILAKDKELFNPDDTKNQSTIYSQLWKNWEKAKEDHGVGSLQEIRAQTALGRYDEMQNGEICAGWEIVDIRDENNTTGMVACLIETDDENALVAFRGSESNTSSNILMDWVTSDLGLLNAYETVQQGSAENYMNYIAQKYGDQYQNFATSGHSLGGNLSFHATLTAPPELRDKISQAYSMDGPGYSNEYIALHADEIFSMQPGVMQHVGWSLVGDLLNVLPCAEYQWAMVDDQVSGSGFQKHDTAFPKMNDDGSIATGGNKDLLTRATSMFSKAVDNNYSYFNLGTIPFAVLEKYLENSAKERAEAKLQEALDEHDFENEQAIVEYLLEHTGQESPEYLVRGALLHCRCGTHARRLNLLKDHGVYTTGCPLIHEKNCESGDGKNITFFGVCKSPAPPPSEIESYMKDIPRGAGGVPTGDAPGGFEVGHKCEPIIVDAIWKCTYKKTRIVDNGDIDPKDRAEAEIKDGKPHGLSAVTTLSYLVCQWGGLIEPYNSGQEYSDSGPVTDDIEELLCNEYGFTAEESECIVNAFNRFELFAETQNWTQQEKIYNFFSSISALQPGYSASSTMFQVVGMPSTYDAQMALKSWGVENIDELQAAIQRQYAEAGTMGKSDFAHETVILATKASEALTKNIANQVESIDSLISFKGDIYSGSFDDSDIISDIDAENLYGRIMSSDEPFIDVIADYLEKKESGEVNPSLEFISNYGNSDVVSGWNALVAEIDNAGMGSEYIANGSIGSFIKNILREGLYNSAMVESGVILQGEDTWDEVMEMGPDAIPKDKMEIIIDKKNDFLQHLYEEGGLKDYGVEWELE